MWWSILRWHHCCLGMQIGTVIFPSGWLPWGLCTWLYSHLTSSLNQEEPCSPIGSPQFAPQPLPFSSLHLYVHTHSCTRTHIYLRGSFSISKLLQYDYSYGNEAESRWECFRMMTLEPGCREFKLNQDKNVLFLSNFHRVMAKVEREWEGQKYQAHSHPLFFFF